MTVLVTGGAGFIGSNLANHLADDGHDVHVVDDCYLGTPENLTDSVMFHDRSVLEGGLPTDVDIVYHLAALSSYRMHEDQAVRGCRVNVEGFVNVVDQARRDGCDTIVFASTSSIYGDQTDPTPEDISIEARTGYEASKLARERYAEYYSHHYDLACVGMRFFSVYQGFGGAEAHKGEYANLVAQFTDKIANEEPPVIYGDGTQTRDFTHVDDVVRALEQAGRAELDGVYNVGTGTSQSLNELVARLNQELGRDVDPEYVENPIDGDVYVHDTCADYSRLEDAVGWTPRVDFDEGVRRVCQQYR